MTDKGIVRGYKIFNPDWTCRGKQYKCPGMFHENVEPKLCETGMHFSVDIKDCFRYYNNANSTYHMAEVIARGRVDAGDGKCCTDDLEIVREIPWAEVLKIVNTGNDCTGIWNSGNRNSGNRNSGNRNSGDWNSGNRNSGDCNSGDCNSGNRNSGDRNSGDRNSGDWNSGDCNSGDWNSGDCNSGDRNSGDWNSGDWNSGDWNTTFGASGCFNTSEQPITMFNKTSEWTLRDWWDSEARSYMCEIPRNVVEWICSDSMTEEEKAAHPEHKTTGGYLKVLDEDDCAQVWWNGLEEYKKSVIMSLPNFDARIFKECTGIDVSITKETE